jgi:hypothetical protein
MALENAVQPQSRLYTNIKIEEIQRHDAYNIQNETPR